MKADKRQTQYHTLSPIADENSKVLILGSFPSPLSRKEDCYYGHPQNRFWRVLAAVYGEPPPRTTEEKKAFALRKGIALYDVIEQCDITGASDASVKNVVPARLDRFFDLGVGQVFVTGRLAEKLYAKYFGGGAIALPSPSAANCKTDFDTLVERYSIIKEYTL